MQRLLFLLVAANVIDLPSAVAQKTQFPYQARVVVEEAYVRSGGGEAFYPTKTVPRDAIVTVRRHDPGGWYMIDPPEGSFSWIPSKYLRQTGSSHGEVIESNVVVFVGSSFGDETHVWQRKMMAGEKVSILGQRELDTLSGPKQMFKIAPPAREYRWIPGASVVPVGEQARANRDRNPYVVPSTIVEQEAAQSNSSTEEANTPDAPNPSKFSPSKRLVKLKQIREEQRQLQSIDQRFRKMILSDPLQWDLDAIENDYLDLQNKASFKPVAGQIDLRYPAINRYRQRKAELDDLNRLTSATEKRDAELLATQFGLPPASAGTSFGQPTVAQQNPFAVDSTMQPVPDNGFLNVDAGSAFEATATSNIPSSSRYIGAGLVQRGAGESADQYLLTSPGGKVLAHLKPDGSVDLDSYVGKSVGLHGKRWFDDTVKNDRIEVSGLEEVRIRN